MSNETLPAVKLAEDIMLLVFESGVDPDECIKAIRAISHYQAGEGTIWGIDDILKKGRMDGRFYALKGIVVRFIKELQTHEDYYLIAGLAMKKAQEGGYEA